MYLPPPHVHFSLPTPATVRTLAAPAHSACMRLSTCSRGRCANGLGCRLRVRSPSAQTPWLFEIDLATRHAADAAEAVSVMRSARLMAMGARWRANARQRRIDRGESSGSDGCVRVGGGWVGGGGRAGGHNATEMGCGVLRACPGRTVPPANVREGGGAPLLGSAVPLTSRCVPHAPTLLLGREDEDGGSDSDDDDDDGEDKLEKLVRLRINQRSRRAGQRAGDSDADVGMSGGLVRSPLGHLPEKLPQSRTGQPRGPSSACLRSPPRNTQCARDRRAGAAPPAPPQACSLHRPCLSKLACCSCSAFVGACSLHVPCVAAARSLAAPPARMRVLAGCW
jgi:hypothetical protein